MNKREKYNKHVLVDEATYVFFENVPVDARSVDI
jgi:hypothetical protein